METLPAKKPKYKFLIIIPTIIVLFSIGFLVNNFLQTGEWVERGIELKGGTLVEIRTSETRIIEIGDILTAKFGQTEVKELSGLTGHAISIQLGSEVNTDDVISELQKFGIDTTDSAIRKVGSALGESFWQQVQVGIIASFIMMGIVIFLIFRTAVPSIAAMTAAISDIIVTLAIMDIIGLPLTLATFAALLMLIGYSVDTDILLTTRVLRGQDTTKERIMSGLKTGLTMTFTSMAAMTALFIVNINPVLSQIALVILIGLSVDIIMTWLQNATILRWYADRKGVAAQC